MPTLTDDEIPPPDLHDLLSRPMSEARFQAAIVRALLDELQHAEASAELKQQVIEELNILSQRILQVADTLQNMEQPRISDVYLTWAADAFDDLLASA